MTTLTLTIDADTVTVTGTERGNETHKSLVPRPWVWSRTAGGYVLPRSLRPTTRAWRIDAFRRAAEAAGVPVEVDDAGTVQSEAERRAAREERLEVRADRHEHAAERAAAKSDAADKTWRSIADGIPFGQPVLVGHHSERRHRRDLARIDRAMHTSHDQDRIARRRAELAENLRRNLERGDSPTTIGNRIKRNEAEVRRLSRSLESHYLAVRLTAKGKADAAARVGIRVSDGVWVARARGERARLAEAVKLDRATLAAMVESGTVRVFSRDTIGKGDAVKAHGRWHRVARVNGKSVSVETGYSWTDTVPYHLITDHRAATTEDTTATQDDAPSDALFA